MNEKPTQLLANGLAVAFRCSPLCYRGHLDATARPGGRAVGRGDTSALSLMMTLPKLMIRGFSLLRL